MKNIRHLKNRILLVMNYNINFIKILEFVPFLLVIFIIPFMIKVNIIVLNDNVINSIIGKIAEDDLFSYYKSKIIFANLVIILCLIIINIRKINFKKYLKYIINIIILTILILFSFYKSNYKKTALIGLVDNYEGTLIIIAYFFIFLYFLYYINKKNINFICKCIVISVFIMAVIGIFEYFNIFLLDSPIFRPFIFGNYYPAFHTLNIKSEMLMTIGPINVVGEYMALFISLLFGFILNDFPFKGFKMGFLYTTYYLLCFSWILCGSRGGIFGGIFGIIVNLFYYRKKIKRDYKKVLILTLSTFALVILLTPNAKYDILTRMGNEKNTLTTNSSSQWLYDINGGGGKLTLKLNNSDLIIKNENNEINIYLNNQLIPYKVQYHGKNNDLKNYIVNYKKLDGFRLYEEKNILDKKLFLLNYRGLRISLNDDLQLVNWKGKPIEYKNIPHIEVGKYGNLFNIRVYLWSRILPIVKEHPIFGIGADCLIFEYPQYDIIGQMRYFGSNMNYLTLCHNHFLQVAINHGIPSLIVYIILICMCLFYHRPKTESMEANIYYAFASAIMGYYLSTMVMDSSVSVAPLAWMCLGICVALKENAFKKEKII